MYGYLLPTAIALALPAAQLRIKQGLPELTQAELGSPNHILTSNNKPSFVVREILPVGDVLGVILPVQQGTAYRWRVEVLR